MAHKCAVHICAMAQVCSHPFIPSSLFIHQKHKKKTIYTMSCPIFLK